MCTAGVLEQPKVHGVFGMHGWPDIPFSEVWLSHGPLMSASDGFVITLKGVGGHSSAPHSVPDPIFAGSGLRRLLLFSYF